MNKWTIGLALIVVAVACISFGREPAAVDSHDGTAIVPYGPRPAFTVCVIDEAGVGFDSIKAAGWLSRDWKKNIIVDCGTPDVLITVCNPGYGNDWYAMGWIYEVGGPIWLNSRALGYAPFNFRVALSHEVGHHFGMQHVDGVSVMNPSPIYLPTVADRAHLSLIIRQRWAEALR